jgi:hypothetical protein
VLIVGKWKGGKLQEEAIERLKKWETAWKVKYKVEICKRNEKLVVKRESERPREQSQRPETKMLNAY